MAQPGTSAPPPEAMKKGVSGAMVAVVVIVVAAAALGAGIFVGKSLYGAGTGHPYLLVGTNVPFPPFEDFNASTGTYVGFDIDLSLMFANATHRTLVVQNYNDFNVLLTTVGTGGVDMAASAITESGSTGQNRSMFMSFSIPYYDANQAVLVKSSSSLTCANMNCTASDLTTAVVGVQSGTTSETWTTDHLVKNQTGSGTVKSYTTVDTEVTALEAGTLDAVIIDAGPATAIAAASSGSLKVAGTIITGELYGFAVAHGDPQGLLPVINSVITNAKADGTYNKLIQKWFK